MLPGGIRRVIVPASLGSELLASSSLYWLYWLLLARRHSAPDRAGVARVRAAGCVAALLLVLTALLLVLTALLPLLNTAALLMMLYTAALLLYCFTALLRRATRDVRIS
jgi:hypothetical protein